MYVATYKRKKENELNGRQYEKELTHTDKWNNNEQVSTVSEKRKTRGKNMIVLLLKQSKTPNNANTTWTQTGKYSLGA